MNDTFHEILNTNGIRIALIGVLSILSLFLLAETIHTASNFSRSSMPATDTVTVQGSGQATLPPDVARVSFTVENTALTVAKAQEATTKQSKSALTFVKEKGVAEKDIKTLSYNIFPKYEYTYGSCQSPFCDRTPQMVGYTVSETIQVTIHDLSLAGEIIGGLGETGVQNLSGPSFALDDATAGYNAARADAIQKAKAQAKLLEKQLGVSLGKIVNFSESSGGYPYPTMYGLAMGGEMKDSSAPNIQSGENTYTASVSITYEIR